MFSVYATLLPISKGATHGSRIFLNSLLCAQFQRGQHNGLLLSDSGYGWSNQRDGWVHVWIAAKILQWRIRIKQIMAEADNDYSQLLSLCSTSDK